ncbi:hypothetical protein FJY84_05685 [Candidatus Bathyarchaeota archaeon]|nr:hypothetical protein [Candidatus Bathyarchaeota archaeon]
MIRTNGHGFVSSIFYFKEIFIVSIAGVILDFFTTVVGLSQGYVETHANYSLFNAFVIFAGANLILSLTLPKSKNWKIGALFISSWSFLGAINNTLVIMGLFSGLII